MHRRKLALNVWWSSNRWQLHHHNDGNRHGGESNQSGWQFDGAYDHPGRRRGHKRQFSNADHQKIVEILFETKPINKFFVARGGRLLILVISEYFIYCLAFCNDPSLDIFGAVHNMEVQRVTIVNF